MAEIWGAVAAAAVSAGSAIYSSQQQKKAANKALDAQRGIAADIRFEPIDIEKLKIDAQNQAIANATASLAIERSLQPEVAGVREELARQVRADLDRGGALPPDAANQATIAARTIGSRSGVGTGSTTPLTASLLGISSVDLMNQRRGAAERLLGQNDLPVAGLDPGSLASLEVANNAALNQFNLEKAGVASNLAESEAAARASQIGSTAGMISTLGNSLAKIGSIYNTTAQKTEAEKLKAKTQPAPVFNYSMPSTPLGLIG